MYVNQSGRSMIEMLGVLGIIGVLTVGGLSIVGKARRQQEITQNISEIAQLIENAKKISCQYDTGYGDYANFLRRSEAYPSQLEFEYKLNDSKFVLSSDVEVKMPFAVGKPDATDEKIHPHFVVAISNMDEDTCMNIASEKWGSADTNGYIGATFNSKTDYADMKKNYPQMDLAVATEKCSDTATLYLGFRACDCETCSTTWVEFNISE